MSLEASDYAGMPADRLTRDAAAQALTVTEEAIARFKRTIEAAKLEAQICAETIRTADPTFIDRWERWSRKPTASIDEAIVGFLERVSEGADIMSDALADLTDEGALEVSRRIAKTGRE